MTHGFELLPVEKFALGRRFASMSSALKHLQASFFAVNDNFYSVSVKYGTCSRINLISVIVMDRRWWRRGVAEGKKSVVKRGERLAGEACMIYPCFRNLNTALPPFPISLSLMLEGITLQVWLRGAKKSLKRWRARDLGIHDSNHCSCPGPNSLYEQVQIPRWFIHAEQRLIYGPDMPFERSLPLLPVMYKKLYISRKVEH